MAQLYTTSLLLSTDLKAPFCISWDQHSPPTNGYNPNALCNTQQLLVVLRICIIYDQIVGKNRQQIIRPLLGLSRGDGTRLCTNWKLPVYPDVTNEKLQFLRNRLRKQLFPLLRCLFNPRFDKSLFQCSELIVREQLLTETTLVELVKSRHNDNCNRLSKRNPLGVVSSPPGIFLRGDMPTIVNPSSRQVVKSFHCLFLPKIGCYFLSLGDFDGHPLDGRGWPTNPRPITLPITLPSCSSILLMKLQAK